MSRDAKIGVVVILIIVGLLVVVWGRTEDPADKFTPGEGESNGQGLVPPPGRLDTDTSRAGAGHSDGLRADSPEPGPITVPDKRSPLLPAPPTTDNKATDNTIALTPNPTAGGPITPTPVVEPPKPKTWIYSVTLEDIGLESIAREQLGDPKRWTEIAKLNQLAKPYTIRPKQKLVMPPKAIADFAPGIPAPAPAAEPAHRSYTVTNEDLGLIQIARDRLNDQAKWKKIAELNGLKPPYTIKVGQVLRLPE